MSVPRTEKKTSHCSMGTRSQSASSAGKFETLGSNFSQETPPVATGVLILQFSEIFFSYVPLSFQRTEKGCSTNPVGEKSPTGFFICKKRNPGYD